MPWGLVAGLFVFLFVVGGAAGWLREDREVRRQHREAAGQAEPWRRGPKHGAALAPPQPDPEEDPLGKPRGLLGWLRDEWIIYRASFVFREELGDWPVVRRPRNGMPGDFIIKAPYIGPRRVQALHGWKPPVLTGVALAALWYCFWYQPSPPQPNDPPLIVGLAFIALIFAGLSFPFWRFFARKTRLKIHFIDGAMIWRGPDWTRYEAKPGGGVRLEGVPHRLAAAAQRADDDFMRRNPNAQRPEPLFQTATEVLALVPHRPPMPVAEFCDDLGGAHALRLIKAIMFVVDRVQAERGQSAARAYEQADRMEY
jgi:hypothetical protein